MTPGSTTLDRRSVLAAVVVWVALSLVTIGVIAAAGGIQRVGYVMAVTGAVVAGGLAIRHLAALAELGRWDPPGRRHGAGDLGRAPQLVDTRTTSMESNLRRALEDPRAFADRLQPTLRELAEHRLRRAHGLDATADPEAARLALGPDLWALLHEPRHGRTSLRRISDAVDRIERIT